MDGEIGFEDLKINCIIGVYPDERIEPRDILVDLKVITDVSRCSESDQLTDAVDYTQLAEICTTLAIEGKYHLLEKYAAAVLDKVCCEYPIDSAEISVRKPHAIPSARYTKVKMKKHISG